MDEEVGALIGSSSSSSESSESESEDSSDSSCEKIRGQKER